MDPQTAPTDLITLIQEFAISALALGEFYFTMLMRPWNFYQICIALALFLLAWGLSLLARPRLHDWLRAREGWPKWRMRLFIIIHRRLRMIFFVILLWIAVLIMREITWPSRSYLMSIFANLASAWLFVVFATRLIDNPPLRSLVRWGAWTWVTLSILNLTERTQAFLEGLSISIGDSGFTAWLLVQALVMLTVTIALARFVARTTSERIRRNEDISPSMQVLAVKFLQVLLYGAALFIGLNAVGVDLTGLAFLSGAIGVGLGFGLQKVVSNLVSGIIILLDKSIKPGDVISLGETFGWINALGARYVSVVTRDGREYLIPNEDLITGQVVNWSHSSDFVRLDIFFGASYGDDPKLVRKLAIDAASGVERVLSHPKTPVCHIVGFGDSSVDYILRFWISDPTGGLTNIRGNVYLALWYAFQENGISIPFPQREVRMLGDEAENAPARGIMQP